MTPPIAPTFDPTDDRLGENLSRGFHLLRAKRRRQVVWFMANMDPDDSITVREVAKLIAADEQGVSVEAVTNAEYRTVYTNLVQLHLPDLDDAGVVDFDANRKVISRGPNTQVLAVMTAIAIPAIHLLLAKDFE